MSIIIMAASSVERVLLIRILNGVMLGRGSGDIARVVESLAVHGQPDAFLLFLVRFVVADYFAVSDLSIFRDVGEFDKETCVGSRNVPDALE
jgi:hypothetical protein